MNLDESCETKVVYFPHLQRPLLHTLLFLCNVGLLGSATLKLTRMDRCKDVEALPNKVINLVAIYGRSYRETVWMGWLGPQESTLVLWANCDRYEPQIECQV